MASGDAAHLAGPTVAPHGREARFQVGQQVEQFASQTAQRPCQTACKLAQGDVELLSVAGVDHPQNRFGLRGAAAIGKGKRSISAQAAFDPRALLNPGKAVPTLHRCAEFGAMHVHKGELPFPDLERF